MVDVIDELQKLVQENYNALPFEVNQKRYEIDLIQIPRLIFQDSSSFIKNCSTMGTNYLAELYRNEYSVSDFHIFQWDLQSEKHMISILLPPLEDFSSLDYCSSFIVLYTLKNDIVEAMTLYAIVESNYGWRRIVKFDSGDHSEFVCRAEEQFIDNIQIISQKEQFFNVM